MIRAPRHPEDRKLLGAQPLRNPRNRRLGCAGINSPAAFPKPLPLRSLDLRVPTSRSRFAAAAAAVPRRSGSPLLPLALLRYLCSPRALGSRSGDGERSSGSGSGSRSGDDELCSGSGSRSGDGERSSRSVSVPVFGSTRGGGEGGGGAVVAGADELAPYAMYRVFRGMGSVGDDILAAAYVGIYVVLYAAQFLSLSAVPERVRFWSLIYTVVVCACVAANALIIGVFIHNYMEFDPSKQQQQQAEAAASELLLPPPPPEMDMC